MQTFAKEPAIAPAAPENASSTASGSVTRPPLPSRPGRGRGGRGATHPDRDAGAKGRRPVRELEPVLAGGDRDRHESEVAAPERDLDPSSRASQPASHERVTTSVAASDVAVSTANASGSSRVTRATANPFAARGGGSAPPPGATSARASGSNPGPASASNAAASSRTAASRAKNTRPSGRPSAYRRTSPARRSSRAPGRAAGNGVTTRRTSTRPSSVSAFPPDSAAPRSRVRHGLPIGDGEAAEARPADSEP